MPDIGRATDEVGAIAAVEVAIVGIRPTVIAICSNDKILSAGIADAMRPGVVRDDGDTSNTMFGGKDQTVITGRSSGVDPRHQTIILSRLRVLENQTAALLLIGGRRARCVADP